MSFRNRLKYKGKPAVQLEDDEILAWTKIADTRDAKPPRKLDNQQRVAYLKAKNPVRVSRMRRDFAWAQKHLIRMGVDPEEVRWLF